MILILSDIVYLTLFIGLESVIVGLLIFLLTELLLLSVLYLVRPKSK